MIFNRTILYRLLVPALLPAFPALSQSQADFKQVLDRIDRLERENDALRQELRTVRDELHARESPDSQERLGVQERRTAEIAQTKVESSQRFPIGLDVGLYPPGNDQRVRFSRPGIVRVFCNIHLTMFAIVAILNTPYIAVSKCDGSFRIDEVKAGEYRLHVFHERAAEETLKRPERTLMIGNDPVSLGSLEISESGYIAVPHKNKFGNDYPSVIEDHPMYPAARNR
jgi:hypothetical protein